MNTSNKRLAIETEDHPLDYANFEGIMPKGQYGAGTVIIWDKGTYKKIDEKKGHFSFELKGKKLKGGFSLNKFRDNMWLLIKQKDKEANNKIDILNKDKSVKSNKTIEQIEKK